MNSKSHWEAVFKRSGGKATSWFQPHLDASIRFIEKTELPLKARIIDVGGGDSTLVDDLLERGFENLSVLDISSEALSNSRLRLGDQSKNVNWIEADIEEVSLPAHYYDVWHDRALFHFLINSRAMTSYLECLEGTLKPGGYAIMATFADDGPGQCSGLPVNRYSPQDLQKMLGSGFNLIEAERMVHSTPTGAEQRFIYCLLEKKALA